MKLTRLLPVMMIALLMAQSSMAATHAKNTAVVQLQHFLSQVHGLKADFAQVVMDPNLRKVKQSEGTLLIKRPNRFRWDYAAPNKEIIVADGERVWMYDVELQQVTVKPLDGTLAASPAVLLSGSNDVSKNFKVQDLGNKDGIKWVGLTPKVKDTDFEDVRLGFKDGTVAVMELKDALGNLTRITFSHVVRNATLSDDQFRFTPPPGADVIGDTGVPHG
ncbi:MAG TPA: outer membrane lipoprotein chaperone LolA [Gammaproteobacteria bacterium]|nr:outer membrane lipoprotein chaperone LolA [Gammaproteobacteria bacterium]